MITLAVHFAVFLILSSYRPAPGTHYRPWVSLAACVLAGGAFAQAVAALFQIPIWPGPTTAGAVVLLGLLIRSRGDLSHIFARVSHQ